MRESKAQVLVTCEYDSCFKVLQTVGCKREVDDACMQALQITICSFPQRYQSDDLINVANITSACIVYEYLYVFKYIIVYGLDICGH